jgi:putative hydrolase of HD superfamily
LNPKILTDNATILKNIPRTGWLQRGVPPAVAETVAEHSFEVASILAVIALESGGGLNKEKMLIMGTIHDWGEAVAGDIPRSLTARLGKNAKSKAEKEIMHELSFASGIGKLAEIFEDYEERRSDEAVIAKIADVLSTQRQAAAYAQNGYPVKDILDGCKEELDGLIGRVKDGRTRDLIGKLI